MLSLGIGMLIVIGVFLAGLMLGSQVPRVMTTSDTVRVHAAPELKIRIDKGPAVKIDGKDVPWKPDLDVPLSAGTTHEIRITEGGYYPVEADIKLNHDEIRILTLERFPQHKKKAATKGSAR